MKKQVVLYKKLSPLLMARLHEQAEVTLIEASTPKAWPNCATPCPTPTACSAPA